MCGRYKPLRGRVQRCPRTGINKISITSRWARGAAAPLHRRFVSTPGPVWAGHPSPTSTTCAPSPITSG